MPYGKGTYGKKRVRPTKSKKMKMKMKRKSIKRR